MWCSACVRDLTTKDRPGQVLARIDDRESQLWRLVDWRLLRPEEPTLDEKNWMPQVKGDKLQFICQCDPTRVLDDRARLISAMTPAIAAEPFGGGSQVIEFEAGWLALIHEGIEPLPANTRFYHHRFVWFDENNRLRRVSRPFFFHDAKGIELAAGLAWHPDGKHLLISYGVDDSQSSIARVVAAEVDGVLEDAGRASATDPSRQPRWYLSTNRDA